MARHASLRASDADREHVVERLRQAAHEGRLDADELEQRVHLALRSREHGELEWLLADLPRPSRHARRPAALTVAVVVAGAIAVLAVAVLVVVAVALLASGWLLWVIAWAVISARRGAMCRPRRPQTRWLASPPRRWPAQGG